jgi:cephalosporin-C deacetylase-like acetyl esterase
MLADLGGLPDDHGPLNARVVGEIHNDSYTVEKVIFESLPGFYVTADVYRPNAPGRYPAVLLQSGHTQEGKPENQRVAANLAMKGFIAFCFDPIGQGERVQTYSRQTNGVLANHSVPEHVEMAAQAQLIGEALSRYFIWDAKRSIDYLVSRPDVDAARLGAAGCSGGGALTTFIGGLDPRLKVVIPACYPSSFKILFPTSGPDAEMIFPDEIASGLDTADFVEQNAPTPWLIQATEQDQFHFARVGVRMVYEEARKWFTIYGAPNNVDFFVGPGWHGMPLASRESLYEWMIRYLKDGKGDFHELPVPHMYSNLQLQVTASGNVEDEQGSRKVYQILEAHLRAEEKPEGIPALREELRNLKIPTDGSAPPVRVLSQSAGRAFRTEQIEFESVPDIWVDGTLYLPLSAGRKPAVLMVKGGSLQQTMSTTEEAEEMARRGRVVLQMEPRTSSLPGNAYPLNRDWASNIQANEIGLNLPAMRAHDILRGVDLLCARPDVDPASIRGAAREVDGIWLLLAAAADPRIQEIWLDHTPYSLREALDNSLTTNLWDAVIPDFILHWDLDDLVKAMGDRRVMWTDPTNWMRRVVAVSGPEYEYRYVIGDTTDLLSAQDDAYIHQFIQ